MLPVPFHVLFLPPLPATRHVGTARDQAPETANPMTSTLKKQDKVPGRGTVGRHGHPIVPKVY